MTICTNKDCPIKHTCYTYNAKPFKLWQNYAVYDYFLLDDKVHCYYFSPLIFDRSSVVSPQFNKQKKPI